MITLPTKTALCFLRSTTSGLAPALVTLMGLPRSARSAWAGRAAMTSKLAAATAVATARTGVPARGTSVAEEGLSSGIVIGTEIADHSSPRVRALHAHRPLYVAGDAALSGPANARGPALCRRASAFRGRRISRLGARG